MSTNPPTLTREQWRTVLDDTDRPTFGELVSTIEAASMIDAEGPGAEQLVDGAVGDLLEADPAHVQPCPGMSKVKTPPWTRISPTPSCDFESYVQGVQGNRISLLILEAEINKTSLLNRVYIINRDSLGPWTRWTSSSDPTALSRFSLVQHQPVAPDTPGHGWTCAIAGGVC